MQFVSIAVTAVVVAAIAILAIITYIQYKRMKQLAEDVIVVKENIEEGILEGVQ